MGYLLELNTLLKLSKGFSVEKLKEGVISNIEKDGERLFPLHKPIEFCDENYTYLGKVIIQRLTLEKGKTIIDFKIVKIFSKKESEIFSKNFIKIKQ